MGVHCSSLDPTGGPGRVGTLPRSTAISASLRNSSGFARPGGDACVRQSAVSLPRPLFFSLLLGLAFCLGVCARVYFLGSRLCAWRRGPGLHSHDPLLWGSCLNCCVMGESSMNVVAKQLGAVAMRVPGGKGILLPYQRVGWLSPNKKRKAQNDTIYCRTLVSP